MTRVAAQQRRTRHHKQTKILASVGFEGADETFSRRGVDAVVHVHAHARVLVHANAHAHATYTCSCTTYLPSCVE